MSDACCIMGARVQGEHQQAVKRRPRLPVGILWCLTASAPAYLLWHTVNADAEASLTGKELLTMEPLVK